MKKVIGFAFIYPLIFLNIILGCKNNINNEGIKKVNFTDNQKQPKGGIVVNELFENFLMQFSFEEKFQFNRIVFPLMYIHLNQDYTQSDTVFIQPHEWKFSNLGFNENIDHRVQIYNNFKHNLEDTDERVFAIYGIRDGVEIYYYFKRKNGEWYLIRKEDLST